MGPSGDGGESPLLLIGGPLHFDREDFPIVDPDLWPFPFELEPLSKSLWRSTSWQRPPQRIVLVKLGLKDRDRCDQAFAKVGGDVTVHRVGLIYDKVNRVRPGNTMVDAVCVAGDRLACHLGGIGSRGEFGPGIGWSGRPSWEHMKQILTE